MQVLAVGSVGLAVAVAGLWMLSMFTSVGLFSLGRGTSVRFFRGVAVIQHFHTYNIAPRVPISQAHTTAVARGWLAPPWPGLIPIFRYRDGFVSGMVGPDDNNVSWATSWILWLPLWPLMIPGLGIGVWLLTKWNRKRREVMRGFPIGMPN
jgi:hypothetical protein